jgi:hypothetical protein
VSGNCASSRPAAAVRPPTPAIAPPRHLAQARANDFGPKTLMLFVIADVSWQFS